MLYALNLFNFVSGAEDQYRRYSVLAGKIIYGLGGRVIAAGHAPLRYLHGDVERRQMIVVEFPSEAVFQKFLDEGERQDIHELREGAVFVGLARKSPSVIPSPLVPDSRLVVQLPDG